MDVISSIYFSQSSDVYQKVVNQERWADQFFSFFPDHKDPEMLWFGARLTDAANARISAAQLNDFSKSFKSRRFGLDCNIWLLHAAD